MTLLPDVRRQVREAAERQAGSRRQRLRTSVMSVGVPRARSVLRLSYVAPVVGVFVAVAVATLFLSAGGSRPAGSSRSFGTVEVVFSALATPQAPVVTRAAMSRTVEIMRERLGSVFHDFQITSSGPAVVVVVRHAPAGARARIVALSARARLEFYDWEKNALTPNGKTVASQLTTQDPTAVEISQGSGSVSPGNPGAGGLSLYDAVRLASKQPRHVSADNAFVGPQYYLFGAPGSAACATAARDQGKLPVPGFHCLLSGPSPDVQDLNTNLPRGVTPSMAQRVVIQPGTVVLQAADASASQHVSFTDPIAQFYVLSDHVALLGDEITNPQQGTDPSGSPDVTFSFTSHGQTAFQNVTAAIAHRGDLVSGLGTTLQQHFAVALDNKLITVPAIDFKTYPDGIQGGGGADITGSFTIQSAQDLATELRLGALPLTLRTT